MTVVPKNKLRGSNGIMLTESLFWEARLDETYAVFTMVDYPKKDLIPFKPLYLQYCVEDPTEYTFAMEVFGSWSHWKKIVANRKLNIFIEKCREERDVAIESNAVKQIIEEATSGKSRFQAAKFLAQKGYQKFLEDQVSLSPRRSEDDHEKDYERLMGDG